MPEQGIGNRIRAARQASGLTQAELAQAVGVSRSAVAQWETQRAGQITGNLLRIAAVLGVGVAHLAEGTGADPAGPSGSVPRPVSGDEIALLRLYRACTQADRQILLQTARRLARPQ